MTEIEDEHRPWQTFLVSCVLCSRQPAQLVEARLTVPLPIRLCFPCQSMWQARGITVAAVERDKDVNFA